MTICRCVCAFLCAQLAQCVDCMWLMNSAKHAQCAMTLPRQDFGATATVSCFFICNRFDRDCGNQRGCTMTAIAVIREDAWHPNAPSHSQCALEDDAAFAIARGALDGC